MKTCGNTGITDIDVKAYVGQVSTRGNADGLAFAMTGVIINKIFPAGNIGKRATCGINIFFIKCADIGLTPPAIGIFKTNK